MSFFDRLRANVHAQSASRSHAQHAAGAAVGTAEGRLHTESFPAHGTKLSTGLKEFLWHLEGLTRGNLLDVGPVWQNTVSFFIERGFRVYTEDVLRAWKDFLRVEEERLRSLQPGEDASEMTPAARAERFLQSSLQYPRETFDAILLWDLFDYLDVELAKRAAVRLASLLKPGALILAVFHSRKAETFQRYRVRDPQNLDLIPAAALFPVQRVYQNREIVDLFPGFHSSKMFVGRDQLREGLFIK